MNIVITGSTRGIGYALAKSFLSRNHRVLVSGRKPESVKAALDSFGAGDMAIGASADVRLPADHAKLWDAAVAAWGRVDVWINNAGISQRDALLWDIDDAEADDIVRTNVLGLIAGSRVAVRGMLAQTGGGFLWNMEGWGSDGAHMNKLNLYGTTKAAVRYYTRGLVQELKGSVVRVGTLSPGLVLTDFTLVPLRQDAARLEKSRRALNVIADLPETVAPYLASRIETARKHGTHVAWLTGAKIAGRFLLAPFRRRHLI